MLYEGHLQFRGVAGLIMKAIDSFCEEPRTRLG